MNTPSKRARSSEAKEQRRSVILTSAEQLFAKDTSTLPTAAQIGKRAEVAKGTLYLYFGSKEEIFLALLEDYYEGWFDSLIQGLETSDTPIKSVIENACNFVEKQPLFFPLASRASTVIEQNIEQKKLISYKNNLSLALRQCAKKIAIKTPLSDDEASQLIMRSYALLLGLWQISKPANHMSRVVNTPSLSGLQLDFHSHSREALEHMWQGVLQRHNQEEKTPSWRKWFS